MFTLTEIAARPVRLEPVRLPLTSLLIVDDRSQHVFDLRYALYLLIGERAERVIRPIILEGLGLDLKRRDADIEIVHWIGDVRPLSPVGRVADRLVPLNTRLLILQARGTEGFAREIVRLGGPATIVVTGGTPEGLERYFTDLYANIIHNYPLRDVVMPRDFDGAPDVHAYFGEGADGALQLTRWVDELAHTIDRVRIGDEVVLEEIARERLSMLPVSVRQRLQKKIRERIDLPDVSTLTKLRNEISFVQETRGVLPLEQLAESTRALEHTVFDLENARSRYPDLARELEDEIDALVRNAPRVLNANFADPKSRELLRAWDTLAEEAPYELLVDVGPRWSRARSLVKGNDQFPEAALPPREDGWRVRVVFFSDDFLPAEVEKDEFPRVDLPPLTDDVAFEGPVAIGEIWVPAPSGRSFPIVNGERSKFAGPLVLALRTPQRSGLARGRLSLYYENNLLQSAVVAVNVGEYTGTTNSIDVDYVLSGDFSDLGRHASRVLNDAEYPVAVNIAMNDDGNGAHRLMVAGHDDLTVSRPYDPQASEKLLRTARNKLKECFFLHDAACRVPEDERVRKLALDSANGKTLQELKCDLFQLAWYGSDLYTHAFGQISSPNLIRYLQKLRAALKSRTVIQIARTSHAQYVYPWAMVYDIPLPNRGIQGKLRRCKVVDEEWGSDGRRTAPIAESCPYTDRPEHQQDMLCPYGFWGFRHYIEQPINVEKNAQPLPQSAASVVPLGNPVSFGFGVTRDASLDAVALKKHVDAIRNLAAVTPSDGADDWDDVQLMLAQPDIAYFLCHGEYDPQRNDPYLGVGPRDNDAKHRVYPGELFQWATTQQDFWSDRRPLVFINGCHTANLTPGEVLSFVSTFANFGASAVIGSEISILLPLAAEVGEKLLSRILQGEKVGEVIHALRWELANKGNLLGLAYTPYCLSDLRFA